MMLEKMGSLRSNYCRLLHQSITQVTGAVGSISSSTSIPFPLTFFPLSPGLVTWPVESRPSRAESHVYTKLRQHQRNASMYISGLAGGIHHYFAQRGLRGDTSTEGTCEWPWNHPNRSNVSRNERLRQTMPTLSDEQPRPSWLVSCAS